MVVSLWVSISSCQWVCFCFFGLSKVPFKLSSLPSKALFKFCCRFPRGQIMAVDTDRPALQMVAMDEHLLWPSIKSSLNVEDLLPEAPLHEPDSEHLSHSWFLQNGEEYIVNDYTCYILYCKIIYNIILSVMKILFNPIIYFN